MNGYHIGGSNPVMQRRHTGVWGPNDPELKQLGATWPTGMVSHCPLTSDANDVIADFDFTNVNSVTFSAAGALLVSASSRYLTRTVTWPTIWTWSVDFALVGNGFLQFGASSSTPSYTLSGGLGPPSPATTSGLPRFYGIALGPSGTALNTNAEIPHMINDGKYHTLVMNGRKTGDTDFIEEALVYLDGILVAGLFQQPSLNLDTHFGLGVRGAFTTYKSDAYVRDFRLWERRLTQAEVLRISA